MFIVNRGVKHVVLHPVFFFLFVYIVLLTLVSCSGGAKHNVSPDIYQTENSRSHYPGVSPDTLVFTGVSARLSSRDESIELALKDAARRLSFFCSVWGSSVKREHIGGEVMDFHVESEYRLEYDESLDKFIDELMFDPATDTFENNNAVFIVARAISDVVMPAAAGHSWGNKRPDWVDKPPAEIGGFPAGVGFSGRLSSHSETVIRSYERAVIAILGNIESHIIDEKLVMQNSYSMFDFDIVSSSETKLSGSLKNFYVIESWTDISNLSVWTLAVASGLGP